MVHSMKKMSGVATACMLLCMQAQEAFAIGPLQIYQSALQNDPAFRAAQADNASGKQNEVIGRSGLLPQVQYSFSKGNNKGESSAPAQVFNTKTGKLENQIRMSDLDYESSSKSVTLRQPLFNIEAYARYKQSVSQTKYSDAQFDVRSKDLMARVIGAYVDAKFAEDQLALYTSQREFLLEQRKVNDLMFSKGEGTKTDMLETQAKLDVAEALLMEAQDNVQNARANLKAIAGIEIGQLDSLRDGFSVLNLVEGDLIAWKAIAERNNAEILAAQLAVEIAQQEITKAKAGYAPRIDFNASLSHGKSEYITTQKQDNMVRSVGVQVVIPLYTGGSVGAISKQAVAQNDKAKADLDGTRSKVMTELQKQLYAVKSGAVKIEALQTSVKSATLLVEATKQSVKGGIRINLDLLNAQQNLVTAKRDLAQARYNYLTSFIKLKVTAGVANIDDLQTVSRFFAAN